MKTKTFMSIMQTIITINLTQQEKIIYVESHNKSYTNMKSVEWKNNY